MVLVSEYAQATELVAAVTLQVASRLREDLLQQERVTLVVSGGKSPVPLFQALSVQPLVWSRVMVTLADERWVPPDHVDSNEALVRTHLLKNRAATAQLVPFWTGDATPEAAAPVVSAALEALPHPFSTVILGMGEDGHIASLFPDAAELAAGLTTEAVALAVHPAHAPHARLSLSRHALLNSRDIVLMITGEAKRQVLARALEEGPVEALPVRAILRQTDVPVSVFWAP
jgi:6-phosphogluconolactonase